MKAKCIREKLQTAVAQVEKVAGKNLSLPVLNSILLEAAGSSISLRATNLNVGVEITIPAKIESAGSVAVKGSLLNTFLSQMKKDDTVELESSEGNITITTESSSTLLKSYSTEDFPTLPKIESKTRFSLPVEVLLEGVKAVAYSAAVSDIKPEISSVYIYQSENELVFVATDSFRLAEKKVKIKNIPEFEGVLVPIKNIQDVVRVLGGESGDIEIVIGENQIVFLSESLYITSRLIDGVFPDYQQIVPKEFSTEVTVLTEDIAQAIRVVDIFSDKFNQVDISVSGELKKCILSSRNEEVGQNQTALQVAIDGEDIETSINHKYLNDVFQSINTDSLTLFFVAPSKPLVVKGVNDTSFMYLIMPMNR